ncbi:hypothetical protein SARC_10039, partial [Sphaeroforma arctica JP610]
VVKQPPYEVTEVGWGEFDIVIEVHFLNKLEKPIVIYHTLKLFEGEGTIRVNKRTIAYELYDELIFKDPPKPLFEALMSEQTLKKRPFSHSQDWTRVEREQLALIDSARTNITNQLATIANKRLKMESEIAQIHAKMRGAASTGKLAKPATPAASSTTTA